MIVSTRLFFLFFYLARNSKSRFSFVGRSLCSIRCKPRRLSNQKACWILLSLFCKWLFYGMNVTKTADIINERIWKIPKKTRVSLMVELYWNLFYSPGRPFALQNCSVTNQSSDSLQVECVESFDGGLPQAFLLELVDMSDLRLVRNLTVIVSI